MASQIHCPDPKRQHIVSPHDSESCVKIQCLVTSDLRIHSNSNKIFIWVALNVVCLVKRKSTWPAWIETLQQALLSYRSPPSAVFPPSAMEQESASGHLLSGGQKPAVNCVSPVALVESQAGLDSAEGSATSYLVLASPASDSLYWLKPQQTN